MFNRLCLCGLWCSWWMHQWIPLVFIHHIVSSSLQQAETTTDTIAAEKFSQRAKKFSIISIVVWICILMLIPLLMALGSYLLTLIDWSAASNLSLEVYADKQPTVQSCFSTATKGDERTNKLVVTRNTKDCQSSLCCCPRLHFTTHS